MACNTLVVLISKFIMLTGDAMVQDHDLDMRGGQIYKAGERPVDRAGSPHASRQSSPIATAGPAEILNHAGQR